MRRVFVVLFAKWLFLRSKSMNELYLHLSKIFNKIGNYFYMKHCEGIRSDKKVD